MCQSGTAASTRAVDYSVTIASEFVHVVPCAALLNDLVRDCVHSARRGNKMLTCTTHFLFSVRVTSPSPILAHQ
jgi:hypothetical protein